MSGTTSGTVSTFQYDQMKVLEHAFRRAGKSITKASGEQIQIATELIFTVTSQWINAGFPLWTRQYKLLPVTIGEANVPCPAGTVDVVNTFWRIFNPWRGAATLTTGVDATVLFAGAPNSDVAITGINPGVNVNFLSTTELDTVGVLLGGSVPVTAALQVQTAPDGVTWTTVQTLTSSTFTPGVWTYFDLHPSIISQYVQIILPSATSTTWTLNQLNFGLANGQDITNGPLNIDDYYNLPNKQYQGNQPNSCFVDRQLNYPVIKVWPCPNNYAFYNGTVTALVRRYIQDPGLLTNAIEVPQRWLEALQWGVAKLLMYELPDEEPGGQATQTSYFTLMAKQQRLQAVTQELTKAESLAWAEERSSGPFRVTPNLRPYSV